MVGTWPRQPRAGEVTNQARVSKVGTKNYVQVKGTSGAWVNVLYTTDATRANTIRDRLNAIFAIPGADLEFITPSYHNGMYVVCWPHVVWDRNGNTYTDTTNHGRTYEQLYKGCAISYSGNSGFRNRLSDFVIASVTAADTEAYGKEPWEIILEWANNIRWNVNGWNCAKDATNEDRAFNDLGTLKIPKLIVPNKTFSGSYTKQNTIYGLGEKQPGFGTGNGDFFHCCDLTIARPKNSGWPYNSWVKITYNGKSVVARVTDQSNIDTAADLSAGTAYALGITGSWNSMQFSAP